MPTKIEWTDETWNPITGCSVVSPGCTNCYAMRLAGTRLQNHPSRAGLTRPSKAGPVWTGEVRFNEEWLTQPIKWRRPRMIFVVAHGDLFHEDVPDAWIDRVFAVMALCPQHTFQVLTKRHDRMRAYFADPVHRARHLTAVQVLARRDWPGTWRTMPIVVEGRLPLPNVWLGTSVEDQKRADERIPDLLATPAAVRFLSCEPLLGALRIDEISAGRGEWLSPLRGERLEEGRNWQTNQYFAHPKIDWVICGGESGPGARPMDGDWARSLRDQCAAAGVPFFFKQHGEWIGVHDLRRLPGGGGPGFGRFDHCEHDMDAEAVRVGKKAAGRLLDGVQHDGMPA